MPTERLSSARRAGTIRRWATSTGALIPLVFVMLFPGAGLFGSSGGTAAAAIGPAQVAGDAPAAVETEPVLTGGDAADDPVIWVHPTNPELSAVIGTDRESALEVYDLSGVRLQRIPDGRPDNVDLRKGFQLGGREVDLVGVGDAGAGNPGDGSLRFYVIDPGTRQLTNVTAGGNLTFDVVSYGFCMYKSPVSGKVYAFTEDKRDGRVEQVELFDSGGQVAGRVVRSLAVGGQTEGCVADDGLSSFYISQENTAIWRYGAEPGDSTTDRVAVDTVANGRLAQIEGLTIVYQPGGTGYLLASSQGKDSYVVYRREGANEWVRTLQVVSGPRADGCSHTDGIDAVAANLGPAFPLGMFVCQDNDNTLPGSAGHQDFKFVRLDSIVDVTVGPDAAPPGTGQPPGTNRPPARPVTASAEGYRMVASDGGIFAFGDATFQGSTGAVKLAKPIVGMAPTSSGRGYWLVASDGGIFAFGDATFLGSTGDVKLTKSVVGIAGA
jgi:myo-inositol-hexaphosphate 3-phosphohydrolase